MFEKKLPNYHRKKKDENSNENHSSTVMIIAINNSIQYFWMSKKVKKEKQFVLKLYPSPTLNSQVWTGIQTETLGSCHIVLVTLKNTHRCVQLIDAQLLPNLRLPSA